MKKKWMMCMAIAALVCCAAPSVKVDAFAGLGAVLHEETTQAAGQEAAALPKAGLPEEKDLPAAVYTAEKLVVRAEASKESDKVTVVPINTEVQLIAFTEGDYVQIEYTGQKGYVLRAYLTKDKEEAAQIAMNKEAADGSGDQKLNDEECLTGGLLDYQKENADANEQVKSYEAIADLPVVENSREAARQFIRDHSKEEDSNEEKFRKCFNYLTAYLDFDVYPMSHYDFTTAEWPFVYSLEVFENALKGDCYGFACCMGVIGFELGYPSTIIITKGDHAFAIVDGRYYGTMRKEGEDGSTEHTSYDLWHQFDLY